jgi:hypothetical protein
MAQIHRKFHHSELQPAVVSIITSVNKKRGEVTTCLRQHLTSSYFSVKMLFIKACLYITGLQFGIKLFHHFPLDFREENISQIVPEKRAQGQKTHNHIPRSKHLDEAN